MNRNNLKIIIGLLTLALVVVLVIQLIRTPTFILPSVYLAGMLIGAILIGSFVLSGLAKLIFKRTSFFLILCTVVSITSIASIIFMINPSSNTLTIIVPNGYEGQVSLILSNVDENILTVDSNGIGYINQQTFDNTSLKPIALEADGTDITYRCVGFNPSTFWGKGAFSVATTDNIDENEIRFLSFEVVPKGKEGQKQYYSTDLIQLIDKTKLNNGK